MIKLRNKKMELILLTYDYYDDGNDDDDDVLKSKESSCFVSHLTSWRNEYRRRKRRGID
jgi:hypothetical protein